MWNGFLRITAMAGVIGVGLFAVFHAQKGMNLASLTSMSGQERASSDDSEPATIVEPSGDSSVADQPDVGLPDDVQKPKFLETPRSRRKPIDLGEELAADESVEANPPAAKVSATRSPSRVVSAKQSVVAPLEDSFEEVTTEAVDAPPPRPKSASIAKAPRSVVRNINATTVDDVDAPDGQPIALTENDVSASIDKSVTQDLDATTPAKLSEPSRQSQEPVDSGNMLSPPPRSKRATQKLDRKIEAEVSPKVLEITDENSSDVSPASDFPDAPPENSPKELESSENLKREAVSDSSSDAALSDSPRSPPVDLDAAIPSDRPLVPEIPRSKPAGLLDDLNGDLPVRPTRPLREPASRRRDAEIRPVDMVGDGIAGDASLRGVQQPRVTIEKKVPQQAVLGQSLVYEIVVKNTGTVDAHNLVIEDRIPKGAKLEGTSPQAELSGRRLVWNQPTLKPSEEKRISIKVIPTQEGSIGSVARVYFATEVTAEIMVSAPQLDFTVKAPRDVRLGQQIDLIYVLKNVGRVDATNVVVRDIVPDELKNDKGNDIECLLGTLAPDEVREIVLPLTATRTGSVVNKAILTAEAGIKKTLESPIDILGEVLVLTRSGQNRLYVERPAVFMNNVRNEGNQRADKIKLTEVVPAGMQFANASDGGRYDPKAGAVIWTIDTLAPGVEKTVNVKYVPKEIGNYDTKISATGGAGSTAAINASVDVVGKAELQVQSVNATGAVTVGEQMTSTIQLNNTGTAAATNVQLVVRLPRELRLVSVKGANFKQDADGVVFDSIVQFNPRTKVAYELVLEPIAEADAQIGLEISADHLTKPGRRVESIQIASDPLK